MSLLARRDLLVAITLWMTGVACGGNSELSPGATVVAIASSSSAVAPGPTSGAPGVALPDLPPDDGLIPIAQPARGATDYLQYREVCALASIAGYAAEVVGVPSEVQPKVEARKDGNSVLRLDVQKVVVAEAGVVVGSQVDVLVAARDGTRFKGSGVLGVWPGLKGSAVELLLSPSPDPAAPWYMRVAHEAPSGVQFVPNECNATHVFDEFARAAGRPNGLDLMRELHREEVKYEACFADSAGATDIGRCDGSVLLPIAEIAQFGEPPADNAAERWWNTDPADRLLAFNEVDPNFLPKLMLLPISAVYIGKADEHILSLSCSLRIGYSSQHDPLPILPASECHTKSVGRPKRRKSTSPIAV